MATGQPSQGQGHGPPAGSKPLRADLLCVVLLLALCFTLGWSRYRCGIDLADEGFLAYGAVRVLEGQVPNRDFVSLQPPLAFYTAAAMFKLFGTSLVSLRLLGLGIYVAIPVLIYALARHLTRPVLALAAALPAVVLGIPFYKFVPFAVWQGITASLAAGLVFLRASSAPPRGRFLALAAGLLSAVSILLRHDQAFYSAISIAAYVLALNWAKGLGWPKPALRPLVGFWLCGVALVLAPFGLYWLAVGALPEMFKQLVVFPLAAYASTSSLPFPRFALHQPLRANAVVALYCLPPLVVLLAVLLLLRRVQRRIFSWQEARFTFLTVWSALFYCQVLARSDPQHLLITLPPFFILCAWCWDALLAGFGQVVSKRTASPSALNRLKAVVSAGAGLLAVSYLLVLQPVFLQPPLGPNDTVRLPRAGVRMLGARGFQTFMETVQTLAPPDRSILCLPYEPMFYFLSERRNPTRWNYLWPGDQTAEDHQALIRQATRDPPAVVIVRGEAGLSRYAPTILDYVHQTYHRSLDMGPFTLYLP